MGENYSIVSTLMHPCFEANQFSFQWTRGSSTCILTNVFLGSVSSLTVCGNLLVIVSIVYFRQLHTPTNLLILSLAAADLLVGLLVFPLSMKLVFSYCVYSQFLICKVQDNLSVTLSTASVLNLGCISIDRYYAVCHPLSYHAKISLNVVVLMIAISWSLSLVVAVGFTMTAVKIDNCGDKCAVDFLLSNVLSAVFPYYASVITMLCLYMKIFLVAQRQLSGIKAAAKIGEVASKMERKATKTLATVLGAFLLCWSPFFLCFKIQLLDNVSVPLAVSEAFIWLALSNSMLNPLIYGLFYSWFRSAFRIIISGKILLGDFAHTRLH